MSSSRQPVVQVPKPTDMLRNSIYGNFSCLCKLSTNVCARDRSGVREPTEDVTVRKNLWYFYLLVLLSLSHAFPRALADGYFLGLGFFSTGKCTVICT